MRFWKVFGLVLQQLSEWSRDSALKHMKLWSDKFGMVKAIFSWR